MSANVGHAEYTEYSLIDFPYRKDGYRFWTKINLTGSLQRLKSPRVIWAAS
nr:MAG TPA: hypothetical protein [Caudoviricetes sp.]